MYLRIRNCFIFFITNRPTYMYSHIHRSIFRSIMKKIGGKRMTHYIIRNMLHVRYLVRVGLHYTFF